MLFSEYAYSFDPSSNRDVSRASTKPKATPRSSTLQDLVIKLASSDLSDLSSNNRLLPSIGSQLGNGATFQVERREAMGEKLVAVKHIQRDIMGGGQYSYTALTRERLEDVFREVRVLLHLNSLQHPSVVELLGYGWDQGPLPYLVLELADLGSLDNFLQENLLSWSQKELTMVQLASGLEMLHACEIIHGDIKLENILVFSEPPHGFIAKLADFGFCLSDTLGAEVYHGTRVLNAPEIRYHNKKYALKSKPEMADVYSYGLAVWEIANDGRRFYSASPIGIDAQDVDKALWFLSEMDLADQEILTYAIEFVASLSLPKTLASQFTAILRMALQRDPQSRSGIREIRQVMDPEERYEPDLGIPISDPCYSIFDIFTAPLPFEVRAELIDTLQKGYEDNLNDYRRLDAFNLSALYALGYGVPQDYEISFRYLKAAASLGHQPAMFYYRGFVENGLFLPDAPSDSVNKYFQDFDPSMPQEVRASHPIRTTHKSWCSQSATSATIRDHCIPLTGLTLEKLLEIADIDNVHKLEVELEIDGNVKRRPLLHHLVQSDQQLLNVLLRKGAVGLSRAHNSDSLLHVACESASTKLVNTLLELYPELARHNHTQGISPLHWLFMFEDSEIPLMAKVLAGRGASTSRVGVRFLREVNLVFSGPPIHWAIMARNTHAVQAMIDLGVDLNKYSNLSPDVLNYPRYTIDVAASLLMPEMVQLLADHGALLSNRKKLPATTAIGHVGDTVDAFRLWLYHGQDVGEATQKTIKVLLDCGAVLEEFSNEAKRDNYTWTTCFPLVLEQFLLFEPKISKDTVRFAAISLQHDPLNSTKLSMILDYCATRMDEDSFLEACSLSLSLCIRDGSLSAAEAILSRLGDVTGAVIDEQNLIHMAANTDHPDMIRLLVSYGGDINLDEDGTAAGTAAMYSKRNALRYLLSHGATLTGGNCTILHDIVSDATPRYESEKTLEMMCDCFHNLAIPVVNGYDSRGFTALHEAIVWGNIKNVSRLMTHLNADGRNIDGTDVSPLYLVALLQEHPPWVILQQGERNVNDYQKSLEAISDYLQNTMGLVPPESVVPVPEIMRFWTLPRLSVWRPVDRLSEWYRSSMPRKTVSQGGWWGVRWRPAESDS